MASVLSYLQGLLSLDHLQWAALNLKKGQIYVFFPTAPTFSSKNIHRAYTNIIRIIIIINIIPIIFP